MTEKLRTKIKNLIEGKYFEEAIKLCDEAIEKDNKDEDAYFLKGSSCRIYKKSTSLKKYRNE
ncbi:hypothetical protein [uncultured Brachyspira sp.]|uniref:hypothetical protein n=1 Tax=uncultured Brachyspira sp. TaxID=221953 RepID=UPI002633AF3B|nr:hypothetical protein [uncultured Brachyspira sp.]